MPPSGFVLTATGWSNAVGAVAVTPALPPGEIARAAEAVTVTVEQAVSTLDSQTLDARVTALETP